jgi:hypothetical protein
MTKIDKRRLCDALATCSTSSESEQVEAFLDGEQVSVESRVKPKILQRVSLAVEATGLPTPTTRT